MNELYVDERYCKGCLICVEVCPTEAIALSRKINAKGYVLPIAKDMTRCTRCKLCELMCPDFAIAIDGDNEIVAFNK